ncbi:MAG TPA: serine hydrolase [Thermoanaerobaculia bacterium]|nr:serine hydrolase [Thermoanaerobaculia bacterium]
MRRSNAIRSPVSRVATTIAAVALAVASIAVAQPAPPPVGEPISEAAAGQWAGAIEIPGVPLQVTVDLARRQDGTWRGAIDIPAQGAIDLPLEGVTVDPSGVTFRIAGVAGAPTFTGTLGDAGATLRGDFQQGGQTFPFSLERRGEAELGPEGPTPAEALDGFGEWMAEQLAAWRVPGAAVAVVAGGEVVLAEGYGLRDVAAELPVTAETLFAIGSATKAFTATVVGTLVDAGVVAWDEPVRTYLPRFDLRDEVVAGRLTVRDLLTHRSGLPRHDLVWYGSEKSREELFASLPHLELTEDLRARFQYQNLMYLTAGYLAGEVAGSNWEELVRERIFAPLGMQGSALGIDALARAEDAAAPYREEATDGDGEEELVRIPYRKIDAVGPAGSINSRATDMARWVLLQLQGGEVGGRRVVDAATLREIHTPQVVVSPGLFTQRFAQPEMPHLLYGLGWFAQTYRGHEMIHHGGNIDGFSALVSFLPRDGMGVVVLTNRDGTLLPQVVALSIYDRLLDLQRIDWSGRYAAIRDQLVGLEEEARQAEELLRPKGSRPAHALGAYAGAYAHPAYGDLVVERRDGGLALEFHTLQSPLEHWGYEVFRATEGQAEGLKVAFTTDQHGDVAAAEVALEAGVEAIAFRKQAPPSMRDPAFLARLAGEYELLGMTLTVAATDEGLRLTVPGQPTYDLEPVLGLRFRLADQEGYGVRFLEEEGRVERLLLIQPNAVLPAERRRPASPG